jgi:hypothetical protein
MVVALGMAVVARTRGDRAAAKLSLVEATHVVTMGVTRSAARANLLIGRHRPAVTMQPSDAIEAMVGDGLPPGPVAIVVGDKRAVRTLVMALNADRSLAAAPTGLLPDSQAAWAQPTPDAGLLVRTARRQGWKFPAATAKRRLEHARPSSYAEAVLTLHGANAWLARKARWVLPAEGPVGTVAVERFPSVTVIAAGEVPQLGRPPTLVLTRKDLAKDPRGAAQRLSETLDLASAATVAAALRYTTRTSILRRR